MSSGGAAAWSDAGVICPWVVYQHYGDLRLLKQPELLEEVIAACRSAAWFWADKELNTLADEQEFRKITRAINGGYNGLKERQAYYAKAMLFLGAKAQ